MQRFKKACFFVFFIDLTSFCYSSDFSQIGQKICSEDINILAKDDAGDTILHAWAKSSVVGSQEAEAVARVLYAITLPNIEVLKNSDGNTPLHIVCSRGFVNSFKFKVLAKWGVPLDVLNSYKQTILHCLAESGSSSNNHKIAILGYLKKQSLDEFINGHDIDGRTALHLAIQNNDKAVFDFLMKFPQVDVNARDQNNDTPLHYAARGMHDPQSKARYFIDNLLRARASVSKKNNDGLFAYKLVPKQFHRIRNRLKF